MASRPQDQESALASPTLRAGFEKICKDAQSALDEMNDNLSNGSGFSSTMKREYKAKGGLVDENWSVFDAAWINKLDGKSKDYRDVISTYKKFSVSILALEVANSEYTAVLNAQVAMIASVLIGILRRISKRMKDLIKKLSRRFDDLKKALVQAKRDLHDAQCQRAINGLLTVVGMLPLPIGLAGRAIVAVSSFSFSVLVDSNSGPSGPSTWGIVVTGAADLIGVPGYFMAATSNFVGAAGAFETLRMDTNEVEEARRIVKDLKIKIKQNKRFFAKTMRNLSTCSSDILAQNNRLKAAIKKASEAHKADSGPDRRRTSFLRVLTQL